MFIKHSDSKIDVVYGTLDDVFKDIVARSLKCARCGAELDQEVEGPMVTCQECGYKTPRVLSTIEEDI